MSLVITSSAYKEVKKFASEKLEQKFCNANFGTPEKLIELLSCVTDNILQFINVTGFDIDRVLSYVDKTEIEERIDRDHIYMIPSVQLCRAMGINEGYAMRIKTLFSVLYNMEFDFFPQQAMTVNQAMIDQEFGGAKKETFIKELQENKNIFDFAAMVFMLYDYQDRDGDLIFSPKQTLDNLQNTGDETWLQENKGELMDVCKFFVKQRRLSKEKKGPIDLFGEVFSLDGMSKYMMHKYGTLHSKLLSIKDYDVVLFYKKLWEQKIIDRDPTSYENILELSLSERGIQESRPFIQIEDSTLEYTDWYRDTILRSVVHEWADKHEEIPVAWPRDIEGYTDEIFFEHRKELLKDLHDFANDTLFSQAANDDHSKGLLLLKNRIDGRLTHMKGLLSFLESCTSIQKEAQSKIFPLIKKMWSNIINRPFAIQQSFFLISHNLLPEYIETYEIVLLHLTALSKQQRKHFVQESFPEINVGLDLIGSMKISSTDESIVQSSYADTMGMFVRKMLLIETPAQLEEIRKEFLENIKNDYLEKYFFLKTPKRYMQDQYMAELFLRYGIHMNGVDSKKLAQVGAMLSLHHHDVWKQWRVDHAIEIPDFAQEAVNSVSCDEENNQLKEYWHTHISSEDLLALQETTSYTSCIKPQTLAEKIFSIQESFQSLFDPDIYEDEIKPIAQRLFDARDKSEELGSLNDMEKELFPKIPIVDFIPDINNLQLHEIYTELHQGAPVSDDKLQKAKNVLNQSRELFRKIVAAYAKISNPESVDIRLEEVANNFSLGIDECERSVAVVESFDKDIQVTSYITVDMKEVIQNIRGCLGCLSKSSNNYKNLAFTRPNRFFITTYLDGEKPQNIADQLLLLLPSDKGLCLVIDTLYGFHSLDILKNHMLCALKKISDIATPIKICIPKSSINSAGTNTNTFMKSIQSMCDQFFPGAKIEVQNISIDSTYAGYNECLSKDIEGVVISLDKDVS